MKKKKKNNHNPLYQDLAYKIMKPIIKSMKSRCEKCGTTNNLTIHHKIKLKDNPELLIDKDNLIVLCRSCHNKIHKEEDRKEIQLIREKARLKEEAKLLQGIKN
jgi:5-methylcytosine-specific restriction endonuclease McrA